MTETEWPCCPDCDTVRGGGHTPGCPSDRSNSDCPACGQPAQVWADNSGGVTVNFACDNSACAAGKGPWDTPRPTDEPTTLHYHWGQNIPGYLPMADEPNIAASFEDAQTALLEDVDRVTDGTEEDQPYEGSMLAALHVADAEIREWTGPDLTYVASNRPHDLGLAFWIVACNEDECRGALENDR